MTRTESRQPLSARRPHANDSCALCSTDKTPRVNLERYNDSPSSSTPCLAPSTSSLKNGSICRSRTRWEAGPSSSKTLCSVRKRFRRPLRVAIADGTPSKHRGVFLNDYPSREHHFGTVHNRQIYPGMLQIISGRASNGHRGTSGCIHLYEGSTLICTLSWACPGGRERNVVQKYDVNGHYWVTIGTFHDGPGPIGSVDITIQRAY